MLLFTQARIQIQQCEIVLVQFYLYLNCTCLAIPFLYRLFPVLPGLKRQNPSQLPATGFVFQFGVLAVDPVGQGQRR